MQHTDIEELAFVAETRIAVAAARKERASAPTKEPIYIKIDGRGQSGQSDEHMYAVYKNLGTISADDQISVTRKLIKENKLMDKKNVGISGHSYGGFLTLMILGRDSGPDSVFKCGISGKMFINIVCFWNSTPLLKLNRYLQN